MALSSVGDEDKEWVARGGMATSMGNDSDVRMVRRVGDEEARKEGRKSFRNKLH